MPSVDNTSSVSRLIMSHLASKIAIAHEADGTATVDFPLLYPDGDWMRLSVRRAQGGFWTVSDDGAAMMRIGAESAPTDSRLARLLEFYGLQLDGFAIRSPETKAIGSAIFNVAQASIAAVRLLAMERSE